jgi:hypothetical protein
MELARDQSRSTSEMAQSYHIVGKRLQERTRSLELGLFVCASRLLFPKESRDALFFSQIS